MIAIVRNKSCKLNLPLDNKRLLLHSCCAPCAGGIIETLIFSAVDFTIFFYNPNIHPKKEYLIRKEESSRFAKKHNVPFIDADYDKDNWFKRIAGLEMEPERGARCTVCFDMRLERTALFAHEHGFDTIATSLGISRWKDLEQVNASGLNAANRYSSIVYWDYNWRKQGGHENMYATAKREQFYRQEYCGCIYSLRDINLWRAKNSKTNTVS